MRRCRRMGKHAPMSSGGEILCYNRWTFSYFHMHRTKRITPSWCSIDGIFGYVIEVCKSKVSVVATSPILYINVWYYIYTWLLTCVDHRHFDRSLRFIIFIQGSYIWKPLDLYKDLILWSNELKQTIVYLTGWSVLLSEMKYQQLPMTNMDSVKTVIY